MKEVKENMNCIFRLFILLTAFVSLLTSCPAPVGTPQNNQGEIVLTFAGFSAVVGVIEGWVTEQLASIAPGAQPVSKTFRIEVNSQSRQSSEVKLTGLPLGVFRLEVKASERGTGVVLFQATREISSVLPTNTASGSNAAKDIVLDRIKGDVQIEVPALSDTEQLVYTARLGLFRQP